jgi:hypothetical protein
MEHEAFERMRAAFAPSFRPFFARRRDWRQGCKAVSFANEKSAKAGSALADFFGPR